MNVTFSLLQGAMSSEKRSLSSPSMPSTAIERTIVIYPELRKRFVFVKVKLPSRLYFALTGR